MAISKSVLDSIKKSKRKNGMITYVELNDDNDKNTPIDPKNEIYSTFKNAIKNKRYLDDVQKILDAIWGDGGTISVLNGKNLVYVSKDGRKTESIDFGFDNKGNIVIKRNGKESIRIGTPEKVLKNTGWEEEKKKLIDSINKMKSHKDLMQFLENYLKGIVY
jgi:hypothetical protein